MQHFAFVRLGLFYLNYQMGAVKYLFRIGNDLGTSILIQLVVKPYTGTPTVLNDELMSVATLPMPTR